MVSTLGLHGLSHRTSCANTRPLVQSTPMGASLLSILASPCTEDASVRMLWLRKCGRHSTQPMATRRREYSRLPRKAKWSMTLMGVVTMSMQAAAMLRCRVSCVRSDDWGCCCSFVGILEPSINIPRVLPMQNHLGCIWTPFDVMCTWCRHVPQVDIICVSQRAATNVMHSSKHQSVRHYQFIGTPSNEFALTPAHIGASPFHALHSVELT